MVLCLVGRLEGVGGGSVSDYRIRNVFITRRIRPAENMLHLAPGDLLQLRCLLICHWVEQTSIEHEVIRFLITHIISWLMHLVEWTLTLLFTLKKQSAQTDSEHYTSVYLRSMLGSLPPVYGNINFLCRFKNLTGFIMKSALSKLDVISERIN